MVAEKLSIEKTEPENNNLTMSTKLSTDQLIGSPEGSINRVPTKGECDNEEVGKRRKRDMTPTVLYFGVLQILFGLLMAVFGVLVLVHEANLSQLGGGLWGGCLATLTGVLGVFSAARDCCPLRSHPQSLVLTAFLALSLISLAVANLVLVLAAIGFARDYQPTDKTSEDSAPEDEATKTTALLTNGALIAVCAFECIAAAFSVWHCARSLCPCFRPVAPVSGAECSECGGGTVYTTVGKDLLVSSWLGKHHQPISSSVYVVAASNQRKSKRMTPITMAPVYSLPTPPPSLLAPPMVGYPLIPAPLGTTPPPLIRPHLPSSDKINKKRRRYPNDQQLQHFVAKRQEKQNKKSKKSREKKKTISEEEVAKTYTGLDRMIAEEFIEICDSTRISNGSGLTSGSDLTGETMSNEFVGERL